MFAHGNRPAGRHHPPLPDTPCRSAQKPEVDAILGEPQARKTAWGFRFGQSDNAHIVSVEARTIASICPRRGKPRGGPAEGRQSLRPAHVFGNLVAFQFFSAAQLPGFVPPQSAARHELIGKSGDVFEEHHHRCDRYRSRGNSEQCRGRGGFRSRCCRRCLVWDGASRVAASDGKAALL